MRETSGDACVEILFEETPSGREGRRNFHRMPVSPDNAQNMKRIRLGMVGGGQGAFIGAVHRMASRIDDRFELVAGALSSDPLRAARSASELGIASERAYADFRNMAQSEAARSDGIEVVTIVTPNHMHAAPILAFLRAGIHVICDKPLCATVEEARAISMAAHASNAHFILTHNYTGYPLIRHARRLVDDGVLGDVRVVQVEFAQDWLATSIEDSGHKQAEWRTDATKSGGGGAIGDIGTHAFNLLKFVTRLETEALSADLHSFGPGRRVDDNAHVLLRMCGGAKAMIWASQIAIGNENRLRLQVVGTDGGLEWDQENPNVMTLSIHGEPKRILTRAGAGLGVQSADWTRLPAGHPEGYLEGFANIYQDAADLIDGIGDGAILPGLKEGLEGVSFIDACLRSSSENSKWLPLADIRSEPSN